MSRARALSSSQRGITNRSFPAVTRRMQHLLLDSSQPRSETSQVQRARRALCTSRTADLRTLRRQDEFTHPSPLHRRAFSPSNLRFAPSGRSKHLSALRGRQWSSTTGPGPVVDPYSTHLAKPFMARGVVERDCSMARGRLQNVDRYTSQALESMGIDARYVRCNGHVLDQARSRPVCSAHHSPPWAVRRVSKLCPEEIKDVAWWRNGGMPSSQRHIGVRPWPGLGAQRVWLSPGAPLASGSVMIATTLLLSRGLLGMRW